MIIPAMQPKEWAQMLLGVLLVTFSAPILGTWALFRIPLAVWNGLSALGPVWAVPLVYLVQGKAVGFRTAGGALLAALGAAMLGVTK